MSNKSIAASISSGLRSAKSRISGLFGQDKASERTENVGDPEGTVPEKEFDGGLLTEAEREILAYARQNQTLLDRAERFGRRAERLSEEDGTTEHSAANKAERARQEVLAGLAALRASFVSRNPEHGERAGAAFDHQSRAIIPNPLPG